MSKNFHVNFYSPFQRFQKITNPTRVVGSGVVPSEAVRPEVVARVLDELDKGDEQPPGVGAVDDEALQQHARDLLLDDLLLRLGEQEEQHAAEVVRVVVRVPE